MRFVDTNVLLYAVSTASVEARKTAVSLRILDSSDLALSVQVLQEFYVQATRPSRTDRLSGEQATSLIQAWLRFRVQENTVAILLNATRTAGRHRISYWDAAVVEAARTLGCTTILSEDMADGQDFDGVRIENPFRVVD